MGQVYNHINGFYCFRRCGETCHPRSPSDLSVYSSKIQVVIQYKEKLMKLFLFCNHSMWPYRTGGHKHNRLQFIYTERKRTRKKKTSAEIQCAVHIEWRQMWKEMFVFSHCTCKCTIAVSILTYLMTAPLTHWRWAARHRRPLPAPPPVTCPRTLWRRRSAQVRDGSAQSHGTTTCSPAPTYSSVTSPPIYKGK